MMATNHKPHHIDQLAPGTKQVPEWTNNPDMSEDIRNIYRHFGQVVLCPTESGRIADTFEPTLLRSIQHKLTFAEGRSVCITAEHPLCCITFHSVAALQAWQRVNRALEATLTTYLPDGSHMFVWLLVPPQERPPDVDSPVASWHGSKRNIEVSRPKGPSHVVMCALPPRRIAFSELNWSFSPQLHFAFNYGGLLLGHGPPTLDDGNGCARLNAEFWAAVAIQELGLRYDHRSGSYLVKHPDGLGERSVAPERVEAMVERLLLAQSLAPCCGKLTTLYGPRQLREIRERIMISGATDPGAGHLSVEQYVRRALTSAPGAAVTSCDVREDYQRLCRDMNATVLPEKTFYQLLKQAVREIHGIGKSASIRRPDGQKNGYRGLRIKLREG